jgi:hypothetical protein
MRVCVCVFVGGGDEGGHPLPGLRGESQEAHLQDGRYVRTYMHRRIYTRICILATYIRTHIHTSK